MTTAWIVAFVSFCYKGMQTYHVWYLWWGVSITLPPDSLVEWPRSLPFTCFRFHLPLKETWSQPSFCLLLHALCRPVGELGCHHSMISGKTVPDWFQVQRETHTIGKQRLLYVFSPAVPAEFPGICVKHRRLCCCCLLHPDIDPCLTSVASSLARVWLWYPEQHRICSMCNASLFISFHDQLCIGNIILTYSSYHFLSSLLPIVRTVRYPLKSFLNHLESIVPPCAS